MRKLWLRCVWLIGVLLLGAIACDAESENVETTAVANDPETLDLNGEEVTPPFTVAGDLSGLMITYVDADGPHTVSSREEIPEASRARVRIGSLTLAPEDRLDPDYLYVADVRHEIEGAYPVRKLHRDAFERVIDDATGATERIAARQAERLEREQANGAEAANASADIIIYGASWCGACQSAASYLRGRGVAFQEKDVERDSGAREEMQAKARAAGVTPSGIPVIDFRGTILTGFDRASMERLLSQNARAI